MNPITPAGHTSTIANKAYTAEPKSELEKIFVEFCKGAQKEFRNDAIGQYSFAEQLLKGSLVDVNALHSVVLNPEYSCMNEAGLFLSAGYNSCKDTAIFYGLDLSHICVGCMLAPGKLLINNGTTGSYLGIHSSGAVINVGNTGAYFGLFSEGIAINAGVAGNAFGCSADGIAIAPRPPVSYRRPSRGLIRPDEISKRLGVYLEELIGLSQEGTERLHERYGKTPAKTIRQDIRKIIKRDHFWKKLGVGR